METNRRGVIAGRQRHTLFDGAAEPKVNYDMEAVKLEHSRRAWPNGAAAHHSRHGRRPSISSEESLSDCEELGLVHTGLAEDDRAGFRRESRSVFD